jgi:adenylate cyclase class IV
MVKEYEARFIVEDEAQLMDRLRGMGATCVGDLLEFRRWVYPVPTSGNDVGWLRLRIGGGKATLTLKRRPAGQVFFDEQEVEVSDFSGTHVILESLGLRGRYQQNSRQTYRLPDALGFAMLDRWPGLPPLLEVEAPSEDTLEVACRLFNFSPDHRCTLTIDELLQSQTTPDAYEQGQR